MLKRRLTRSFYFDLSAIGLFVVLALICTFPFIAHPLSTLAAPIDGDVASSVAKYQVITQDGANPFTTERIFSVSFPEGITSNLGVDRVSFILVLTFWIGSLTIGPILTHSLLTIFGYLLTATVAFIFVKLTTRSTLAGTVAGLVFGFSSHMYTIARAAGAYTHMWLLILPLLAFWWLAQKGPRWRSMALATLSIIPALFWTPYFAVHVMVVGFSCLIVTLLIWRRRYAYSKIARAALAIVSVWVLLLASYWYAGTNSTSTTIPPRTSQEAYLQSTHPLMYVVPGPYSRWGHTPHNWLANNVPQAVGTNLYIGLSVLSLAGVALFHVLSKRRLEHVSDSTQQKIRIAGLMAGLVALSTFLFSLPPKVSILSLSIPTPNYLIVEAVPALRAGQRFVMPLMGAMGILAGIGAFILISKIRRNLLRVAVGLIMLTVIVFDLWALPPSSSATTRAYPSLHRLRQLPDAPTAHFHKSSLIEFPAQKACLLQIQHKKTLVNDCALSRSAENPNQPPPFLAELSALPICHQVTRLEEHGAKYFIVPRSDNHLLKCFDSTDQKFKVIASDNEFVILTP
jgi:hypothetical protein